jgi:hypothetical protein
MIPPRPCARRRRKPCVSMKGRSKQEHRRKSPPVLLQLSAASSIAALGSGFFVGHPSSERSQHDCAHEHERRERRQKIQIQVQGTVHEWPPLWFAYEYTLTEPGQIGNQQTCCAAADRPVSPYRTCPKRLKRRGDSCSPLSTRYLGSHPCRLAWNENSGRFGTPLQRVRCSNGGFPVHDVTSPPRSPPPESGRRAMPRGPARSGRRSARRAACCSHH